MSSEPRGFHVDPQGVAVAEAGADVRGEFLAKTYQHLAGAIIVFIGLLAVIVNTEWGASFARWAAFGGQWNMLIVLVLWMVVSYLAESWAHSAKTIGEQYAGLGVFIVAEALLFTPIIYFAGRYRPDAIGPAAVITIITFGGLSAYVLVTKKDFSFMRTALAIASFVALAMIVSSIAFGFNLGIGFSAIMVVFCAGAVLYQTSQVMNSYPVGFHVAASLALFASIALMFWYILQIFLASDRD